jgi:hypothetical protein
VPAVGPTAVADPVLVAGRAGVRGLVPGLAADGRMQIARHPLASLVVVDLVAAADPTSVAGPVVAVAQALLAAPAAADPTSVGLAVVAPTSDDPGVVALMSDGRESRADQTLAGLVLAAGPVWVVGLG